MDHDEEIARLIRIEERVKTLQAESDRTRKRLHRIEPAIQGILELQKARMDADKLRDKRTNLRLQILTATVGAAGVITPLVTIFAR